MDKFDPLQLAGDVNWEIAKGYLRAVVAVQGARTSGQEPSKFTLLRDEVEGFIKAVEEQELQL
jgi:hypothetical protein